MGEVSAEFPASCTAPSTALLAIGPGIIGWIGAPQRRSLRTRRDEKMPRRDILNIRQCDLAFSGGRSAVDFKRRRWGCDSQV